MKLVTVEKNEIRLSSCMNELAFGKTNYDSIVTQAGILAECDSLKDEKYHFTFKPWCFSEIKSYQVSEDEEPYVFYCGKNPLSTKAKSLLEFFEAAGNEKSKIEDKDKMFSAAYIITSIYTQAASEGVEIPINGAGGIFVDLNKEKTKILFLPQNLFKYSSAGLPPVENANVQGCWLNPTLFGLPALCFARAVIVYKMLTGRFPYPSADTVERNADILDRKFLPLELCINGIDSSIATETNKALKLNSNEVAIPGKKKKGKSSEDLTPTKTFPLENLLRFRKEPLKDSKLSDQEFEEKVQNYIKLRDVKINAKRKIRRNVTKIVIGVIAVFTLAIVISSTVKNNLDDYSSKGLTSTETIEAYYKAMNLRDAVLMGAMTKGKNTQRYVDSVSQVYVMGRARQASSRDLGFVSPENWLLFVTDRNKNSQASIFGVSNVKIDGKLSNLNPELHKKIEKIPALQSENGITLADQSQSVHSVEYYFLISEGETNEISIEKINATITLTYVKDKWLITDIEPVSTKIDLNNFTFKSEYFYSVSENNGDVIKAVGELRNKYSWLPSDEVLKIEQIRLEEERNFPMKSLGL